MSSRLMVLVGLLGWGSASAQAQYLQNDTFTGTGQVNSSADFAADAYEGPGVILTPTSYPVTIVAIDVLLVGWEGSGDGQVGAYLLNVWAMDDGGLFTGPPTTSDGNVVNQDSVQLTTSSSQLNDIPLAAPVVLTSGNLFVELQDELDSEDDGTTVAIDDGPMVPGVNFLAPRETPLDDAGVPFTGNWIVRARLVAVVDGGSGTSSSSAASSSGGPLSSSASGSSSGSSASTSGSTSSTASSSASSSSSGTGATTASSASATASTASSGSGTFATGSSGGASGTTGSSVSTSGVSTSAASSSGGGLLLNGIAPSSGSTNENTPVTIEGANFLLGVQVLVGSTLITDLSARSSSVLSATVPSGIALGTYDVTAINPDGSRAILPHAYTVTGGAPDGGSGTAGAPAKGCGCRGVSAFDLGGLLVPLALWSRRRRSVGAHPGS